MKTKEVKSYLGMIVKVFVHTNNFARKDDFKWNEGSPTSTSGSIVRKKLFFAQDIFMRSEISIARELNFLYGIVV